MTAAEALGVAARDRATVARYWSKVARPFDTSCWIWTGAISDNGHGRFWIGGGRVVISHRFGWALAHDGEPVPVEVRHDCDNPLCQNPTHLRAGVPGENIRDYLARVGQPGSPLNDVRGSLERARAVRDAARKMLAVGEAEQLGFSRLDRDQPPLW